MKRTKSPDHVPNLLNYNELSLLLTGSTMKITREKIPREHIKAITQLNRYLVRWVNKNKVFQDNIPRVAITLENKKRVLVKMPKIVPKFRILKSIPPEASMLHNGLWEFEGVYFTTKLDMKEGLQIKEWYNLEDAKNYLQNK